MLLKFIFDLFVENCHDQDQTYTLSYSVNDAKRKKRSTSTENDIARSEIDSLYTKIDELQTHVLSQQETLINIVNKVKIKQIKIPEQTYEGSLCTLVRDWFYKLLPLQSIVFYELITSFRTIMYC